MLIAHARRAPRLPGRRPVDVVELISDRISLAGPVGPRELASALLLHREERPGEELVQTLDERIAARVRERLREADELPAVGCAAAAVRRYCVRRPHHDQLLLDTYHPAVGACEVEAVGLDADDSEQRVRREGTLRLLRRHHSRSAARCRRRVRTRSGRPANLARGVLLSPPACCLRPSVAESALSQCGTRLPRSCCRTRCPSSPLSTGSQQSRSSRASRCPPTADHRRRAT